MVWGRLQAAITIRCKGRIIDRGARVLEEGRLCRLCFSVKQEGEK